MTERPILFSAPMVRAILDGRKTQTRRVVKELEPGARYHGIDRDGLHLFVKGCAYGKARCPYGDPGDLLWVRETWRPIHSGNPSEGAQYRADKPDNWSDQTRWRPAIHMFKWASRITLRITDMRVERLNEISEADARAEGASECANGWWFDGKPEFAGSDARGAYYCLWEHINGPGSWDKNPWVWAVACERVQP